MHLHVVFLWNINNFDFKRRSISNNIDTRPLGFFFAECSAGTYGLNCGKVCGNCSNGDWCFHMNGSCPNGCDVGVFGDKCDQGTDSAKGIKNSIFSFKMYLK